MMGTQTGTGGFPAIEDAASGGEVQERFRDDEHETISPYEWARQSSRCPSRFRSEQAVMARPLTPAEVATRWQCSERKVRYMVERGALPAFNLDGKLLRLRLEDVEAFECGGSPGLKANAASPGTDQTVSGDVIDLEQATRKRRPASPRLDTLSLRDRAGRR